MSRFRASIFCLTLLAPAAAPAQDAGDVFSDAANGAKLHVASGFLCPAKIGMFERDAAGERDPQNGADFCAYSALNGVYGTITLVPLKGPYDPKSALVPDFLELEGTGGRTIAEAPMKLGGASIYTRTYQTTSLENVHYQVLFAASAVGQWALEVTMEYASPRDDAIEREFLSTVYAQAFKTIAAAR